MFPKPMSNRLLQALSPADRQLLQPHLEPVELNARDPLELANTTITHAYFPDSGMISVVARSADDQIEAGVIGREGMSATAVVMGNHRSPNDAYVQISGTAHRIETDHLRAVMEASAPLRTLLQKFASTFLVQVTQTALANGRAKISERLARWLLMAHDRVDDEHIRLTHEFISVMLGVRRPGVTDAVNELEGLGLIRAHRAAIQIVDREGLLRVAGSTYGVSEAEYKRLLG
jgi:CRP-like cAMP-binding protein